MRDRPLVARHVSPRLSVEAVEVLSALPGVGPVRARALAGRLESLGDLARLGVRDLMEIPGIGPDTAARIVDVFHKRGRGSPQS